MKPIAIIIVLLTLVGLPILTADSAGALEICHSGIPVAYFIKMDDVDDNIYMGGDLKVSGKLGEWIDKQLTPKQRQKLESGEADWFISGVFPIRWYGDDKIIGQFISVNMVYDCEKIE